MPGRRRPSKRILYARKFSELDGDGTDSFSVVSRLPRAGEIRSGCRRGPLSSAFAAPDAILSQEQDQQFKSKLILL